MLALALYAHVRVWEPLSNNYVTVNIGAWRDVAAVGREQSVSADPFGNRRQESDWTMCMYQDYQPRIQDLAMGGGGFTGGAAH